MKALKRIWNNLGDGALLLAATFLVNLSNYGLNLILGRWLGPEGFAEANLIATLVMLLSFVAMGLQLTVAKLVAEGNQYLVRQLLQKVLFGSVSVSCLLLFLSPMFSDFLNFGSFIPLLILFVGIPSYFIMSISRGYYQGDLSFMKLAMTYLIEMVVRLVVTLVLLYFFIGKGAETEIIAFGFLLSFLVTHYYNRLKLQCGKPEGTSLSMIMPFLLVIAFYELSQILINNSDVILVKHFFTAKEAGLYASMALLGRAVFFATWTVVTILFPKVIEKEKKGEPHLKLFWSALFIVGGIGFVMVAGTYFLGDFIMDVAFGSAYESVSHYLWIYTLMTSLFACANVFVYYNMSLEKYLPVYLSIAAGLLQILLLYFYHSSIEQVLTVQLYLMSALLIAMMSYQLITSGAKYILPNSNKKQGLSFVKNN